MADEFVSTAQFSEFVRRIDERFDHVQKDVTSGFASANQLADQRYDSINQRLADADKAREQNMVHVNQRFDDMKESMSQRGDAVNQRFDDMNRGMNQRFDSLEKRFDDQRRIVVLMLSAILTAVIGGALAGLGAAAKYLFFSS